MTRGHTSPDAGRVATRTDRLVLAGVLILAGGFVWLDLFNGWLAGDNGAMSQVAARVLAGQLPRRDFDDPWTGGYSFLQAALFRTFGASPATKRPAWRRRALAM